MEKELLIFRNYDESTPPVGKLILFDVTAVDADDVIAFGVELPPITLLVDGNFIAQNEPTIISAAIIPAKNIDKRTWREKLTSVPE